MTRPIEVEHCPFRDCVREKGATEIARCRLLQEITGVHDAALCAVRRDACEACCQSFPPSPAEINPIIGSLLYELTDRLARQGGVAGCNAANAARLRRWARENLESADLDKEIVWVPTQSSAKHEGPTPICDVIVCCGDSSKETGRAVRSALTQQDAVAWIHLVDDGGGGRAILEQYRDCRNVVIHRNPVALGLFATLHQLVPHLRSEYVAVQDTRTISRPDRLGYSVRMLREHAADLLAAALESPGGTAQPQEPGPEYRRYVPPQSLVFRRAALVDLGGIADRREGVDAELVYRAAREGRKILLSRRATVDTASPPTAGSVGPAPDYAPREGILRHHAKGFPQETIACDVVLPFHGHLDYVREAMQSLLDQEGAEVVIHLVDDASPGNTEPVLRHWGTHPRVRIYRNERNLGQFTSFNNVFPYRETGLLAVQDADDVSLPQRIWLAGNALRLADADIFGGRTRRFWDGRLPGEASRRGRRRRLPRPDRYRFSGFPAREQEYFLVNPTALMRANAFEMLGGFGDFGDGDRNLGGLDTEFYARARYSGVRFAMSRDVVVRYRCHADSVTHNALTGWGTPVYRWWVAECRRRAALFRLGPFDPRAFGALRKCWGLTRRLRAP